MDTKKQQPKGRCFLFVFQFFFRIGAFIGSRSIHCIFMMDPSLFKRWPHVVADCFICNFDAGHIRSAADQMTRNRLCDEEEGDGNDHLCIEYAFIKPKMDERPEQHGQYAERRTFRSCMRTRVDVRQTDQAKCGDAAEQDTGADQDDYENINEDLDRKSLLSPGISQRLLFR